MLIVSPKAKATIPFVYRSGYNYVDPDDYINIFLKRGFNSVGPIILGPYKYSVSDLVSSGSIYIANESKVTRQSQGSYILEINIPSNLADGVYTVEITSKVDTVVDLKEINLQSKSDYQQYSQSYDIADKQIKIGNKSRYQNIGQLTTQKVLLIGHTDAIEPYGLIKLQSIEQAITALRADINSPLLRGVFDAYSAGARDLYIMSAGYMSEYVSDVNQRNVKIFKDNSSTTNYFSFYDLYYLRLTQCYKLLQDHEYLDIIVPLEASIINTGTNNFVKQLATHCNTVQVNTGEVQIGIIGSRDNGTTTSSVDELSTKNFEITSQVDGNGYVLSDHGRYVILLYGEAVFSHKQLQTSYSSSIAAAFAGMLASTRIDRGLTKARIPSALSMLGENLTLAQVKKLQDKKINTIVRGQRSRRLSLFDIYVTSDYTQSISPSYEDAVNVRLVSFIISEIQSLGNLAIGKFGYDKIISHVEEFMLALKTSKVVVDYKVDSSADAMQRGTIYFNITVTSSRTLRKISFNVSTGKGS